MNLYMQFQHADISESAGHLLEPGSPAPLSVLGERLLRTCKPQEFRRHQVANRSQSTYQLRHATPVRHQKGVKAFEISLGYGLVLSAFSDNCS